MRMTLLSIPALLAVAACSQSADETAPPPSEPASGQSGTEATVSGPPRHILAFGDSLFAGYGVGKEASYPAQLQAQLRQGGINAEIANAGVSGDTSAAGLQRLAFTLDAQPQPPELVILELGANDMLRGLDPEETRANLTAMLDELQSRGIPVLLMGMRAPPNYGAEYQRSFDSIYGDLAEREGVSLVPFWLETIYQRPELFQSDRLHPTREGLGLLAEATKSAVVEALGPAPSEP
ncbi:arylesterase [Qipengyuania sp.]|uniref:arylesterase n=1 Tax=Qipengyuania sp. TaxID=2004515 RepID=UPI0035C84B81